MKKLIIFLLVLVSYYSSIGQAISNRSSQTITVKDARWMAGLNAFIPVYGDTLAASQPINIGIDSCGAIIFTYNDNGVWYRGCSPKRWLRMGTGQVINDTIYTQIPIAVRTDSLGHRIIYLLHLNGLESGGLVSQHSCWSVDVTPSIAYYSYIQHSTPQVLALPIDSTVFAFPRYVNIIIDSNNNVSVQEGTASAMPSVPQINQFSQIILTSIFIPAGATCLPFGQEVIFDGEDDDPTQWTPSQSGTLSNNFTNTDTAYHLIESAFTQTYESGAQLIFTKPSGVDTVKIGEVAKAAFYSNGVFQNQISWQWYNGTNPASNPLVINGYFNPNDSNQFQLIVVPLSAWQWPGGTVFNKFVITFGGSDLSGAKGVYHDYIQLQTGIPTQIKQYQDSSSIVDGYLTDWYNGVPVTRQAVVGATVTADNGLTKTVNNIQLGGTLIQPTTIVEDGNFLRINGAEFFVNDHFEIDSASASYRMGDILGLNNNSYIAIDDNSTVFSYNSFSVPQLSIGANQPLTLGQYASGAIITGRLAFLQTDTGRYKPVVIDTTNGSIWQGYWKGSGGGSGSSLANFYLKDSTLSDDRSVDLDGHLLSFFDAGGTNIQITPSDGSVKARTPSGIRLSISDDDDNVLMYHDDDNQIEIKGGQIVYTSPKHIFPALDSINNAYNIATIFHDTLKITRSDTTLIPSFSQKVRSLFSNTSPITYNSGTGLIGIAQATTSTNGYLSSTDWNTFNNKGSGTVTSVTGTTNRITSTGGATPVIDISASYVGQSSITTLGTVTTGTLSTGAIIGGVTMTLGSDAQGDIYYRNGSGILTRLAAGTTSQKLTGGTTPSWKDSTAAFSLTGSTGDLISFSATNTKSNIADVATGSVLVSGGVTTLPAYSASPTLTTSLTVPLDIGGTGTTSSKTYKTTTGVGTTGADHIFQVGNNGATEAMRIMNSGNVGIGLNNPQTPFVLRVASDFNLEVSNGTGSQVLFNFLTNARNVNVPLWINASTVGIGVTSATATLHIRPGTATANTAPLKFTSGVNLTTPETGAMEFDGTDLSFTPTGTIRKYIPTSTIGRSTAQTAAVASIVTETVGASDASYLVSANVLVTTATVHSFTATVTYTDEGNTSRTLTLQFSTLAGAFITAMTNAQGTVPYEGVPLHIRAKSGTTITIATTGTFTTVVYNVEAMIQLLK